jgi:hypothetical protein
MKFLALISLLIGFTAFCQQPTPHITDTDTIDVEILLSINEDCQLPCLFGLTPGESTKQEMLASDFPEEITERLSEDSFAMSDGSEIDNFTIFFDEAAFLSADFVFEDNLLSRMQIIGFEPAAWSENEVILNLTTLVEQYSLPQDLLLNIDGPESANFVVTLIYDKPSILAAIQFSFREPFYAEDDSDNHVHRLKPLDFCFEYADVQRSQLWIFPSETTEPENIVLPDLRRIGPTISNPNVNLLDLLDISEDTFVEMILSPEESCISGPSLSELDEMGYVF